MDPKEYKSFHEKFMQNNNGTSAIENFLVILPSAFTTFQSIQLIHLANVTQIPLQFAIEFILIVLSIILNVTVCNHLVLQIAITLCFVTIVPVIKKLRGKTHLTPFIQIPAKKPEFISIARAIINIISVICILAVDFQCFPRSLAKTETYGYGLMDVGVGLFVFGNGIVAPDINRRTMHKFSLKKLQKISISCIPFFLLGFARFFITKEIDYQQHVSEYGVHWNFFITLAAVRLGSSIVLDLLPNLDFAKYVSIGLLCLHEMTLQLGLAQYVLSANVKREESFVNANREGIVSTPGYIVIYVMSAYVGHIIKSEEPIIKAKQMFRKFLHLAAVAGFCWKMMYVCDGMFGVSRRLANMGYVFWVMSIGCTMVSLLMLLELFVYYTRFEQSKSKDDKEEDNTDDLVGTYTPVILTAINYNGLVFFLLANVLTGLVNIVFQTMLLDTFASLSIIIYYMFILCVVMVFLYVNKIKMKFW
jgi:glucosaminylphosphatidylinositol acyltransferase